MTGSVRGAKRLQVDPVFRLCEAGDLFQFLEVFAACTVTELALDCGSLHDSMYGGLWRKVFAALPAVRRLELLFGMVTDRNSGETKRSIAEHFLTSARILQQAGHETSLAWVLRVPDPKRDTFELREELGDVERVLLDHAHQGGRLKSLELYVTTSWPKDECWSQFSGVTQITTDRVASRLLTSYEVSGLAFAADTVMVGGGWGYADDDWSDDEDDENGHGGQDKGTGGGGGESRGFR